MACEPLLGRRRFLTLLLALLAWPRGVRAAGGPTGGAEETAPATLPEATRRALESSPYVYVSPLRRDGSESRCHGEVWYGWLDDTVVVASSTRTWKARALAGGLDRAQLWVGDFGRWKRLTGRNEAFRQGPNFPARARALRDPALLERLLAVYEKKYPSEIERWGPRMRREHAAGERVLIRYEPLEPAGDVTRPDAERP